MKKLLVILTILTTILVGCSKNEGLNPNQNVQNQHYLDSLQHIQDSISYYDSLSHIIVPDTIDYFYSNVYATMFEVVPGTTVLRTTKLFTEDINLSYSTISEVGISYNNWLEIQVKTHNGVKYIKTFPVDERIVWESELYNGSYVSKKYYIYTCNATLTY